MIFGAPKQFKMDVTPFKFIRQNCTRVADERVVFSHVFTPLALIPEVAAKFGSKVALI